MLLDPLVTVIETLQRRIHEHGDSLRQNEYRTRMALIDPLLQALGWDVANPGLVTPEYDVSGQRADYALLKDSGGPATFVEAKKLGESLMPHRLQMVNYANMSGVPYAGLTDGNNWELYVVFDQKPLPERLILDLSIANLPAIQLALKFMLLWRPNLASGQPVPANEPIVSSGWQTATATIEPSPTTQQPASSTPPVSNSDGWVSLADIQAMEGTQPPEIRLPDGTTKQLNYWYQIPAETAEWLTGSGQLTANKCPIRNNGKFSIVHTEPIHGSGKPFFHPYTLSNGLFLNKHGNRKTLLDYAKKLLTLCGQDPASVWLKVS